MGSRHTEPFLLRTQPVHDSNHPSRDPECAHEQSIVVGLGRMVPNRRAARELGSASQRVRPQAVAACSGRFARVLLQLDSGRVEPEKTMEAAAGAGRARKVVGMDVLRRRSMGHFCCKGRAVRVLAAVAVLVVEHKKAIEAVALDCIDLIFAKGGRDGRKVEQRRSLDGRRCVVQMAKQDAHDEASSVGRPCVHPCIYQSMLHRASKCWRRCVRETRRDPFRGSSPNQGIRHEREDSPL